MRYSNLFANQPSSVPTSFTCILGRDGYERGGVRGYPESGRDTAVAAFGKSEAETSAATCEVTAADDDSPAPLDKSWTDVCAGGGM
jgi:hypothetical protein